MGTALNPPDKNPDLFTRIEDLWLEAAANLPENRTDAGDAPTSEDFAKIREKFETVAKLKPPLGEDGVPSESAFDDLVRAVVRDYIENNLEDTIRDAVKGEIKAQGKGKAKAKKARG